MPILANVVINDGAGTPVARTFNPGSRGTDGMQRWYEKSASAAIGFWVLGQHLREPVPPSGGVKSSDASRVYKHSVKIEAPVMEVTSPSTGSGIQPAPTIAYTPRVEIVFHLPERSTEQDRKHVRALAISYLGHDNTVKAVDKLEPVYNG